VVITTRRIARDASAPAQFDGCAVVSETDDENALATRQDPLGVQDPIGIPFEIPHRAVVAGRQPICEPLGVAWPAKWSDAGQVEALLVSQFEDQRFGLHEPIFHGP
jgi:hypothetical protein